MVSILEDKSSIKQEQNVLLSIILKFCTSFLMYVLRYILSDEDIFKYYSMFRDFFEECV